MATPSAELELGLTSILQSKLEHFVRVKSVERLSGGANQETYSIAIETTQGTDKLALRRAAGGSSEDQSDINIGLDKEAALFQIAGAANVPSPEIIHLLTPQDGIGDGFIMSWLEGETLGSRIVRAGELGAVRPHLAQQCGEILARIHAIDIDASGLSRILPDVTPRQTIEQTWARYRDLKTPQPMIDYTARWLLDNLPADSRRTLVHNDFRNGNLVINENGIVGVLDWEVAHIGDPMRDLGWLCTPSWRFGKDELAVGGFGEIDDLIRAYEANSGITIDREALHYWQVFGAFWWAAGCLAMADHYRNGPDRSVERPAIGRRSSECQADCVNLLIPGSVELLDEPGSHDIDELPRTDELLDSVSDFLNQEIAPGQAQRTRFLSRVAANSLAIVKRELAYGQTYRRQEETRLQALFQCDDTLFALRWQLVEALRNETIELDNVELIAHLRQTVISQLSIDQPSYPALDRALASP